MSSTLQRPVSEKVAILGHANPEAVVAYRGGKPVSAAQFARDVAAIAALLPASSHVLDFCTDRYRFAVVLCAALVRGQITLLPPTTTPNVISAMRNFADGVSRDVLHAACSIARHLLRSIDHRIARLAHQLVFAFGFR